MERQRHLRRYAWLPECLLPTRSEHLRPRVAQTLPDDRFRLKADIPRIIGVAYEILCTEAFALSSTL